jgi:small conductance mechanosensitive channel
VKDNLANFAGGVLLLFNKPFKGGDCIQAQNIEGTVETIGILLILPILCTV